MASKRFDVGSPLTFLNKGKGQLLQAAGLVLDYKKHSEKQKLMREQLGNKEAKSRLESEYKSRIYQVNDRLYANKLGEHKFQYNTSSTELKRREAMKAERTRRMQMAWDRGEKAPIMRGVENDRPIFERDDEEGNVIMVSRDEYAQRIGQEGYVDLIERPDFKGDELWGFETDPDDITFKSSGSLETNMQNQSSDIEKLSLERQILRYKEASRRGLSDPKDISAINESSLRKTPTIREFATLSSRIDFDGMSDNQKDSLMRSINDMGGIENAVYFLKAGKKMDHAKWIAQFYQRVVKNPDQIYNFSEIHDSYFRNVNLAAEKRGFAQIGKKSGIDKTVIQDGAQALANDGSFEQTNTQADLVGADVGGFEPFEASENFPVDVTTERGASPEQHIRSSAKRRMSRSQYKRWQKERDRYISWQFSTLYGGEARAITSDNVIPDYTSSKKMRQMQQEWESIDLKEYYK